MTCKLSILTLTIPGREDKLQRLLDVLIPQVPTDDSVEVIVKKELPACDGGPTIGANRNTALADAIGDYVCFIDEDDLIPEYYVEKNLKAIESKPDVVGIRGHYILGGNKPKLFIHSIKYKEWKTENNIHYRCPNHLNPVRRELALKVPYPEKNYSEDKDYSMALLPLLKTEVMIDDCIMYFYLK